VPKKTSTRYEIANRVKYKFLFNFLFFLLMRWFFAESSFTKFTLFFKIENPYQVIRDFFLLWKNHCKLVLFLQRRHRNMTFFIITMIKTDIIIFKTWGSNFPILQPKIYKNTYYYKTNKTRYFNHFDFIYFSLSTSIV